MTVQTEILEVEDFPIEIQIQGILIHVTLIVITDIPIVDGGEKNE